MPPSQVNLARSVLLGMLSRHAQDVSQSRWVSFLVPSDQILRHSD